MRGKAFIEDDDVSEAKKPTKRGQKTSALGKSVIVISELPYQVVKARLVAHIADLVNQGVLQGNKPHIVQSQQAYRLREVDFFWIP